MIIIAKAFYQIGEKIIKIDNVYKFLLGIVFYFGGFFIKMRIAQ
ncbi:hypothetical protein [Paraclostridium sordellii]|nr:hypothetical protein [Paeniclostridium sordellii]MDU6113356.1 hypothetical protein [Paeniclostridium sordellii]